VPIVSKITDETRAAVLSGGIEQIVVTEEGVIVEQDYTPKFIRLEDALQELVNTIYTTENLKLRAARIVQEIWKHRLYEQQGFKDFNAFLPTLLTQTAEIGWGSKASLHNYLFLVEIYIDLLGVEENRALNATSHLLTLMPAAAVKKGYELLEEPTKPNKLGAEEFETATHLILGLLDISEQYLDQGLSGEQTAEQLPEEQVELYEKVTGRLPLIERGRGWTVADTQAFVKALKGVADEPQKDTITRVWTARKTDEGVLVLGLQVLVNDIALPSLPLVPQLLSGLDFQAMIGEDIVDWQEEAD
jgi:hypothetical protein